MSPLPDHDAAAAARIGAAWRALAAIADPELPALTLEDLGIVRFVRLRSDGVLCAGLSPTYSGCPASAHILELAPRALREADVGPCAVSQTLAPPWSSDWITSEGRRKLAQYGIVPPERVPSHPGRPASRALWALAESAPAACPRCGALQTEQLSEFGSTPCKALHRCLACLEPFERFKCI